MTNAKKWHNRVCKWDTVWHKASIKMCWRVLMYRKRCTWPVATSNLKLVLPHSVGDRRTLCEAFSQCRTQPHSTVSKVHVKVQCPTCFADHERCTLNTHCFSTTTWMLMSAVTQTTPHTHAVSLNVPLTLVHMASTSARSLAQLSTVKCLLKKKKKKLFTEI